jgi:translation initiation factor 5B
MTKAQKEAQARNELRMKQMLESGAAKVAGLEEPANKKPVYDNRKKKGPKKGPEETKADDRQAEEEAERSWKSLSLLRNKLPRPKLPLRLHERMPRLRRGRERYRG